MSSYLITFLLENNYANTETDAFKILEASSDEFREFIILELFGQESKIEQQLQNTQDPDERRRLRERLKQIRSRNRSIKRTFNSVKQNVGKKIEKSKPVASAKRFIGKTLLGGLVPF